MVNIPNNSSIDLSYLKQCTKSNPALMMEMISLYLIQTPQLVDAMNKSAENNDWSTLYSAVHKIIPSFTIMGINKDVEKLAREIQELTLKRQHVETIPAMVVQLASVCIQSCLELTEEFNLIKISLPS